MQGESRILFPIGNGFVVIPQIIYISSPVKSKKSGKYLFCIKTGDKEDLWVSEFDQTKVQAEFESLITAINDYYKGLKTGEQ